jgi:hypothetical protein
MREALGRAALTALLLVLGVSMSGCGDTRSQSPAAPGMVSDSALEGLLLSVAEINTVMGTSNMAQSPMVTAMSDDRNLLPNVNCLGVWQVDQAAIYGTGGGPDGWQSLRKNIFRTPDDNDWTSLVVQSVVSYPSAQAAQRFFGASAQRWSKCTDHHVNITLNDRPLPKWLSGDLARTETRLAIPIARGVGDHARMCQHSLSVASNVIIEVEACSPPTRVVTQAAVIADQIESSLRI